MEDPITALLSKMAGMSLNTQKDVKLKARDLLRQLSVSKLDQLIDIVTELQRDNAKSGFNPVYHKTCSNVLLMIIERKNEIT